MNTEELVEIFNKKPYLIKMGKGALSKRLKVSKEVVVAAKKIYYSLIGAKLNERKPNILVLDIETAPMKGYIFKLWKDSVNLDKLVSDWYILCWSAKWLFSNEVKGDCLTSTEAKLQDDRRITISLASLLNKADIVITHNGKKFDLLKINARMLIHQLPPIKSYQNIDTLEIARRQFGFTSNKLNYLAQILGVDTKLDTDFQLWADCVEGKQEALDYMLKYNKWDVECLEAVYLRLRPWIKNHPNLSLYYESTELRCPNCGSSHLTQEGFYYTSVNKYQVYRCECGAVSRIRNSSLNSDLKPYILNNNLQ